jgi:hypothetical protein
MLGEPCRTEAVEALIKLLQAEGTAGEADRKLAAALVDLVRVGKLEEAGEVFQQLFRRASPSFKHAAWTVVESLH